MPLIRYPGSKAKLIKQICEHFPDECSVGGLWAQKMDYREPFFGAGAAGFQVLEKLYPGSYVWLNDKDYGLASLWNAVKDAPEELCERISEYRPSTEDFYEWKASDGKKGVDPVEAGFRKLAVHQMSVSGFGVMSGGPLGGRDQSNARYKVDCRWNPTTLKQHVRRCHRTLNRFRCRITMRDFSELLSDCRRNTFVYLDPPYVGKGGILYKHNMTEADHRRLRDCLFSLSCQWVVSYDDHPLVRELYDGCRIIEITTRYSNATHAIERPKNHEVVIVPK